MEAGALMLGVVVYGGVWWCVVTCLKGAHVVVRRVAVDVAVGQRRRAIDVESPALQAENRSA